jgi:agmatinase
VSVVSNQPHAFGGIEAASDYGAARFAVLPIPYDGTSTWQKGADEGPEAILRASAHVELYDIETGLEPYRAGIVTLAPVDCPPGPELLAERVRAAAIALIDDGKRVIGLGGEHSVSIGLFQAHAERYPGLTVLQFDAHGDTRDSYEGSRYNHACVMARAAEIADYVQVGIRSLDVSELGLLRPERTFFAHAIAGSFDFIPRMVECLGENVYITIDLDCLDPSVMPSTGTPEPGGLDWYQLTRAVAAAVRARNVVGFDVVELMPSPADRAPDFLAAKLVYQIIGTMVAREQEN